MREYLQYFSSTDVANRRRTHAMRDFDDRLNYLQARAHMLPALRRSLRV